MDTDALLQANPDDGWLLIAARSALSKGAPDRDYANYLRALERAARTVGPVFAGQEYAGVFSDVSGIPEWMVVSLITNAEREGDGATRLWSMASRTAASGYRARLQEHAVDESRHSLLYLSLLDLCFPSSVEARFRRELASLSPRLSMHSELRVFPGSPYGRPASLDDFVQMNIAELRTTLHHVLQRRALEKHCPPAAWPRVRKILDSLLNDELYHVAYTAEIINGAPAHTLEELMHQRVDDFDRITRGELCQRTFE
jgi:hypothetical protein